MNHERLAELYILLDEEFKKTPINHHRIGEINHYIAKEIAIPDSPWSSLAPADWKPYVTAVIGILIAANTQFHYVSPDLQNAILALAVTLGLWTVQTTQAIHAANLKKIKTHFSNMLQKK